LANLSQKRKAARALRCYTPGMPQLITNAIIVINDGNGTIHHATDLLIAGNRIMAIGQGIAAQHPGLTALTPPAMPSSPASPTSTPTSSCSSASYIAMQPIAPAKHRPTLAPV
jgi:hypothetical protein